MRPRARSIGKTTIKLPTPLYQRISKMIDGAGYNSVTDFVVYVLRDLVGQIGAREGFITEKEVAETRQRLRNLGYL